jgi:AraC-like DNA-binding protein
MSEWSGRVFVAPGRVVYAGPGGHAYRHAHHAVQVVACWGGSARVELAEGAVEGTAAVIPADVPHALVARAEIVAVVYIEPEDPRGRPIQAAATAGDLDAAELARRLDGVPRPDPASWKREGVARWSNDLLARVATPVAAELHPSVRAAVAYLADVAPEVARLGEAAAETGISPSRLTHVFKRQIGIPLRRFALWVRTKRAVEEFLASGSLTEAAHAAGFSDASHFCRTFRALFGLRPSAFLGHVQFRGTCHEMVTFPTMENAGCI